MSAIPRTVTAAVIATALVTVVAACGSSSSSSSGGSSLKPAHDGSGQDLTNGTKGGTLTVFDHEDFQHLDPGQAYFQEDYEVMSATQRPLFMFPPNSSTQAVPDLASGPAIVSPDGKTVTVHIRTGVHFSPPVNRAVTSADVAYAIERGANPNVANPYFPAYFYYIEGASKANGGPISGISTPNPSTIVFHLTGSYGTFFVGALSLPLSAPVPKEFAAKYDAMKPTQYGTSVEVATGPYMLKSDASGRFLGIGYQPGKSATLVRNPNWNPSTDPRPAYLDQININIGGDPNVIGRQVLTGSHVIQNDPPAAPIVKLAYQNYYNQLVAVPGAGDYYVAVNNKQGPFSNVNVRKALWAALDREAIVKARGGSVVSQAMTHFIYPGSAGYAQAGGDHGPNVDYNNYPSGNIAVAEKYMKLAGYSSGRYTGSATVRVVGSTGDPAAKQAAIVNRAIQSLGFKTNFTLVDQSVMYGKCGVPAQEIDACPNVGWVRDWSDPQTILDPAFAGYNIVAQNNSNWGQVNDPQINSAMKAAEAVVGDSARAAAWANIDKMLVNQAVAAPETFEIQGNIESKDVRGINDLWNGGSWDYSYSSLK
jgi:peptide/nickel transport system substrate-binding protein